MQSETLKMTIMVEDIDQSVCTPQFRVEPTWAALRNKSDCSNFIDLRQQVIALGATQRYQEHQPLLFLGYSK